MKYLYSLSEVEASYSGQVWVQNTGHQYWIVKGKPHTDNGDPSAVTEDGEMFWHNHGILHRLNGPAYQQGEYKSFFIDGTQIEAHECWTHPEVIKFKLKKLLELT